MRVRIAAMCLTLGLLIVACGAPDSGGFSEINMSRIPAPLTATTTTTTTTTIPTTTILATTTTVEKEPAATTTTTFVPTPTTIATEPVRLYYILAKDIFVQIDALKPKDASVAQVMAALQAAPTGEGTANLRTAIPEGEEPIVTGNADGLVTVDLSETFGDDEGDDYRLAIAQIVLTFTIQPGISAVTFTRSGEPTRVVLADGTASEVGQVLHRSDFEDLLDSTAATTTTTTTIDQTSTTVADPASTESTPVEEPTTLPAG